jgi:hypothetical protein
LIVLLVISILVPAVNVFCLALRALFNAVLSDGCPAILANATVLP